MCCYIFAYSCIRHLEIPKVLLGYLKCLVVSSGWQLEAHSVDCFFKPSSRLGIFALWLLSPGYNWCGMHSCTSCCILFFNCNYIHYLFKISAFKPLADNLLCHVIAFSLNPGRVLSLNQETRVHFTLCCC